MYSLLISSLLLIGSAAMPLTTHAEEPVYVPPPVVFVEPVEFPTAPERKLPTTEEQVREYFSDVPILAEVANCESQFTQFKGDDVLRGRVNPADVGVMQINEYYHGDAAKRGGYDIYTLEGNMRYGRQLYEDEGLAPWEASRFCWQKHL